jgi:alkaline phosphatase
VKTARHGKNLARRDWLKLAGIAGVAPLLAQSAAGSDDKPTPAKKVRGVVFMVSDGMSPGVLTLAESFSLRHRNRGTAWWRLLEDRSAHCGLMDTASANSLVTDSAAASSAWGGGQRVNNGRINIDAAGGEITPIAALLKKSCDARVGLVTTATVTHATPAGFAANVARRDDEHVIAPQYLGRVDVILGGGSKFFDPSKRADRRDLFAEFGKNDYHVLRHRDELMASRREKLLGTFSAGHLPFSIDRDAETNARVPTLAEMAQAALERFLTSPKPFLLQVEGARIDHAAHLNDIGGLLHDQLAFDDALAAVLAVVNGRDDILVVATSDHGNANPGFNGWGDSQRVQRIIRQQASHEWIFAQWAKRKSASVADLASLVLDQLDLRLKPPEAEALHALLHQREVVEWNHQLSNPEGLLGQIAGNHTGIGWTGTSHTSDPTLVSATGPQANRFAGMLKNTDVFTHLTDLLS